MFGAEVERCYETIIACETVCAWWTGGLLFIMLLEVESIGVCAGSVCPHKKAWIALGTRSNEFNDCIATNTKKAREQRWTAQISVFGSARIEG